MMIIIPAKSLPIKKKQTNRLGHVISKYCVVYIVVWNVLRRDMSKGLSNMM